MEFCCSGRRWALSEEFHRRLREGPFNKPMASIYMDLVILRQRHDRDEATREDLVDGGRIWPQTVDACLTRLSQLGYVDIREDGIIELLDVHLLVAYETDDSDSSKGPMPNA